MRPIPSALGAILVGALATSCSDPIPPAAKGAYQLTLNKQGTQNCNISSVNANVGTVSTTAVTSMVTHGDAQGSEVTCVVKPSGAGFIVSGAIVSSGQSLSFATELDLSRTSGNPAPGSAGFYSKDKTGAQYRSQSDTPCRFWFENTDKQGVTAGKAWFSFGCEKVVDNSSNSECTISAGVVLVENCAKE